MTLEAETMTKRLTKQTPSATLNEGARNPERGAWYIATRYNTTTEKYIVLTALIGTAGNLYGTVLTEEDTDGKIVTAFPKTYKQILNAFN